MDPRAIALKGLALVALTAYVAAYPQPQSDRKANFHPSTNMCGNDERVILTGTPWLVADSMYGAAQMVGFSCTYFENVESSTPRVVWRSNTAIHNVKETPPPF
ncbi:hypothetical protein XANCAGTX0491_001382 [Xanthoria calcicola]